MSPTRAAGFSIVLATSDGERRALSCGPAMTVLHAAEEAGMILPSLGQSGSCGSCFAEVSAGEFLLGSHSEQALGRRAPPGATLLCRTYPRSDCTIELPYESARIGDSLPAVRDATIALLEPVARATVRLDLSLAPAAEARPEPSSTPARSSRSSFQSRAPLETGLLAGEHRQLGRLARALHPAAAWGLFSTWLAETAAVGDALIVHGPQGAFGLRETGCARAGSSVAAPASRRCCRCCVPATQIFSKRITAN